MTWNYRVCKETFPEDDYYSIREVYYNNNGEITAVTEDAVGVSGYTIDEMKFSLEKMNLALNKDVVDLNTIVFASNE